MSPSLLARQRGRLLRGSLLTAYSSPSSLASSPDGASGAAAFLRRLLVALLAVACFSAGWACRGGGGGGGRGGGREEAFLSSLAGPSSSPPRSNHHPLSLPHAASARPTDTLVVYIFANSGKSRSGRERSGFVLLSRRRAKGKKNDNRHRRLVAFPLALPSPSYNCPPRR